MFKTESKKEYLIAFRPVFLIFACTILAILGTYFFIIYNILGLIICLSLFAFLLFYMIYRKQYLVCAISLLLCACCGSIFVVDYVCYNNDKIDENITYTITGRADEVCSYGTTTYTRTLHNCTIKNGEEIIKTNKNIQIVLMNTNIECGDIITFNAQLENIEYFGETGATYFAYRNIDYTALIYASNITETLKDNLSLKEKIKVRAYNILHQNMSNQSANLAYAVVFGDKSYLNIDVKNAFIESGIAHVLAVSGLHTSLIFALLIWLLKRVKIKYYYKLALIATFIGFFAYLCDFAPSIVRASIMALVLSLTYLRSTKFDGLNILSLAGVLILLIQPLQLFNVGFSLSFACMLSMILFDPFGKKVTNFIPNTQVQSLFVSAITTTVGTLPIMALYFGKLSLTCVIANVILLPIFVYAYTFLFVAVVLCLLLPFGFMLVGLDYVLESIIKLCMLLTLPANDYIRIFKLGLIGTLISFVLIFTCTSHLNLKQKIKIPLNIALAVCVIICAVFASTPKMQDNTLAKIDEISCVYCLNQKCSLFEPFSSNKEYNSAKNYLEENNLYDIENMFVLDYSFVNVNKIEYFTREFKVQNLYLTYASYTKMKYYLDNYFTNSNIIVLDNNANYSTSNYNFNYQVVTNNTNLITIKNGEEEFKVYSKKHYV